MKFLDIDETDYYRERNNLDDDDRVRSVRKQLVLKTPRSVETIPVPQAYVIPNTTATAGTAHNTTLRTSTSARLDGERHVRPGRD